ncbi:phage SPO1 DNA polymerase-related protein [Petrotoga mobilis SJ95]|jgi:DNA polymerase|uniref:Type-4 uracil-DNA glycosylase n=1 Tax=Petrotoga mobilis (strain DSM 10674 / SJ95) TaxID=403833 RepID=A9BHU0_PETMO|nr:MULTISPECIES: uracil-DNA glycosylase [Petrotoga]ABX32055.1 phage SPO1 DNA polymerase-related protein [Petrotoga mobilis SJ95]MBL5981384.1 DNA polymerase [Petrotoga sp. 8T1HF07.NaAc.6.1]RLL85320.1 DNA polymerase [Petrotoga sp. Shatin.DS.tank11.9.2.9.3]
MFLYGNEEKQKNIEMIAKRIEVCEKCPLNLTRTNTVPGSGNVDSPIMFVGEGPGADEDALGEPFVGRAGQLLEKMLKEYAKLERNDVFITNIVKCRPPQNRVPTQEEVKSCQSYLDGQIIVIKPKIIVTLGNTPLYYFTGESKITQSRGRFFNWYGDIKIFPTFHPSYLLRNQSSTKGSPKWYAYLDMRIIGIMYRALKQGKDVEEVTKTVEEKIKSLENAGGSQT